MKSTRTLLRIFGLAAITALVVFAATSCRSPVAARITYYTVTFDTGGGSAVEPVQVAHGTAVARPENPTRDGYVFADWYTCEEFTTPFDFNTPIIAAITIYARWTERIPDPHTVTFDTGGGTEIAPVQVTHGGTVARPADPAKGAYIFAGWYTDAGFTTQFDFTTPITAAITIYARWTEQLPGPHIVTFNTDGGTEIAPVQVAHGGTVARPADPTRGAYIFAGWYTGTGLTAQFDFTTPITAAITLYARWTEQIPDPHTVTFNTGGGTAIAPVQVAHGGTVARPADPTRGGYIFAGWYTSATFTAQFAFTTPVTAAITIYARWTGQIPGPHTVTFDTGGGTAIAPVQVAHGGTVARPTDPTRGAYIFAGWYTSATFTAQFAFTTPITGAITLYARWATQQPGPHTVTFDTRGGSAIAPVQVAHNQTVAIPGNPTRAGYYFAGWYTDTAFTTQFNFNTQITGNITVFARWLGEITGLLFEFCPDLQGYRVMGFSGAPFSPLVIPAYRVDGTPVLAVADSAFRDSQITELTIHNGVRIIGDNAFSVNLITNVEIPDSVTHIGEDAFWRNRITDLCLGNGVVSIGRGAFGGVHTVIQVPWDGGNQITGKLIIPDSVTYIGAGAFTGNMITGVVIPPGVTTIRSGTFSNNQIEELNIPGNVTYIGVSAFANNQIPGELVIPPGVRTIGPGAFIRNWISSVVIPDSVTYIGSTAFADNQITGELVIPHGVIYLGGFAGNRGITGVVIPDSVSTILRWAFGPVEELTSITIGSNVTTIESMAFWRSPIESITIPAGVYIVDAYSMGVHGGSFRNLYNAVGRLAGRYDFINGVWRGPYCVYCVCDVDVPGLTFLRVGDAYSVIGGTVSDNVVIPDYHNGLPVRYIARNALRDRGITHITIGRHVTSIGSGAFLDNRILELVIPAGVTTIEDMAFMNNRILELVIPAGVTIIEDMAFSNNVISGELFFPDSVVYIGEEAFSSNHIADLRLPNGITSIQSLAFQNNRLVNLVIPDNVTQISNAFEGNRLLRYVTIGSGVTGMSDRAFHDTGIVSITIPADVQIRSSFLPPDTRKAAFLELYSRRGRLAGTYVFVNGVWRGPDWQDTSTLQLLFGTSSIHGYAWVSGATGSAFGHVVIPDYYLGFPVTAISSPPGGSVGALQNRSITGITFGRHMNQVGVSAFRDNLITGELVIPDGFAHILSNAFRNNQITGVMLPNRAIIVGAESFRDNAITGELIIPDNANIHSSAFRDNAITSVIIGDDVTVGIRAFQNNAITSVIIGDGVTVGAHAFEGNAITSVIIGDGVTINNQAFISNPITSITIGDGVVIRCDIPLRLFASMGSNGLIFNSVWEANGRQAGTYTFDGTTWILQP